MFQNTGFNDMLPRRHSVKTEKYPSNQKYIRNFKGVVMAIEELQKDVIEQREQHERTKKELKKKLTNERIKHQLEMKHCKKKIEELENELKCVEKTKYALVEDGKYAEEYLADQARNNVKQKAHLYHLRWLIKIQRARIEKLENSASAAGPPDAVESAEAIKTTTPVARQRTEIPKVRVVRQRPYATYVIISVFRYARHTVL